MNWVDLVILLIFLIYAFDGYRRGFFKLTWELLGLFVAFVFAFKFYMSLSGPVTRFTNLSTLNSKIIAFLVIWFLTQFAFYLIECLITHFAPFLRKESKLSRILGLIPGIIKGGIFVTVFLTLIVVAPVSQNVKDAIDYSFIGKSLINVMADVEKQVQNAFGTDDAQTNAAAQIQVEENSNLNFTTTDVTIDEIGEDTILVMTNNERVNAGLKPLEQNKLLKDVARAHSRDMAIRGYFSHTSLNGDTLLTRLNNAHVVFSLAAENIAYAPTVALAHTGLMNSPKHRANILNPTYTKVGIGIISAGTHGLLVTEDFTQ